jgi:hypothetical protein
MNLQHIQNKELGLDEIVVLQYKIHPKQFARLEPTGTLHRHFLIIKIWIGKRQRQKKEYDPDYITYKLFDKNTKRPSKSHETNHLTIHIWKTFFCKT